MRDYTPQNYELFCISGHFGMVFTLRGILHLRIIYDNI